LIAIIKARIRAPLTA